MTLKTHKMEYARWNDIEDEFQKLCKKKYGKERDLRDWGGRWSGNGIGYGKCDEKKPLQDFWFVMCDSEMVANDKMTSINFYEWWMDAKEYSEGDDRWIIEVLELLAEVCQDRDLNVLFSW